MNEIDAIIIVALARGNMKTNEAARRSHYHRNTVCWHIEKIKRDTGLNPLNFFDLGELYTMALEILGDKSDDI